MNSPALLPCPFCNGEAIMLKDHTKMGFYIACTDCSACTITRPVKAEATADWNRRSPPVGVAEPVAVKATLKPFRGKPGEDPCPKCRLQPGETCAICGASAPEPVAEIDRLRAENERLRAVLQEALTFVEAEARRNPIYAKGSHEKQRINDAIALAASARAALQSPEATE